MPADIKHNREPHNGYPIPAAGEYKALGHTVILSGHPPQRQRKQSSQKWHDSCETQDLRWRRVAKRLPERLNGFKFGLFCVTFAWFAFLKL